MVINAWQDVNKRTNQYGFQLTIVRNILTFIKRSLLIAFVAKWAEVGGIVLVNKVSF